MLTGPPALEGVSRGPCENFHTTASDCPSGWQLEQDIQKFLVMGNCALLAV